MIKNPLPSVPAEFSKGVILKWNSQQGLAAVPESAFDKERRHVDAALRTMTNPKQPAWEGAFAIICVAIENYREIRSKPEIYEYVKDLTLSQFLMWELVRFLDTNQPHRRLSKDKGRLALDSEEAQEQRLRRQLAKRYGTDNPVEIDCLRHAENQDLAEHCCDCEYEAETLRCKHPEWPHITKDSMDSCFTPKEEE